jgi:hypothetical protein
MRDQCDPKADDFMTPDERERLRQLNIRLFKHGLPQVRSISEFSLRVYRQTNPKLGALP